MARVGARHDRLLKDTHVAAGRVEARRDQIPDLAQQGFARGEPFDRAGAAADPQREFALLVDEQAVAGFVRPGPLRQDTLNPFGRRGGKDHRHEREAAQVEARVVRHEDVCAGMNGLRPARIVAVHRGVDFLLFVAGAVRVGIAVDEPHDVGAIGFAPLGVYVEPDCLPGPGGDPVAVAGDPERRHERSSQLQAVACVQRRISVERRVRRRWTNPESRTLRARRPCVSGRSRARRPRGSDSFLPSPRRAYRASRATGRYGILATARFRR